MTRWRRTTACERAAQWISLELDGELGRLEQAALARHLGRCDRCRVVERGDRRVHRAAARCAAGRARATGGRRHAAWARRPARATLRGWRSPLVAAASRCSARSARVPRSGGAAAELARLRGTAEQQRAFAREHVRIEPTFFDAAPQVVGSLVRRARASIDSASGGRPCTRPAPPPSSLDFQESRLAKNGSPENGSGENVGSLIEIKGVVVDAVFPDRLPVDLLGAPHHAPRRRRR